MTVDYAQAFRDGCIDSPVAIADRTDVEVVLGEMCDAVTKEAAKVYQLPEGRGPAMALVIVTYAEEKARSGPANPLQEGQARVYMMHGEWEKERDDPLRNGVELLSVQRTAVGYPVNVTAFDGSVWPARSRSQLEAALGNILRSPNAAARIRKSARDFQLRPTFNQ